MSAAPGAPAPRKEASPESAAMWRSRERTKALARFDRELDRIREQLDRDVAFVYEATVFEDATAVWAEPRAATPTEPASFGAPTPAMIAALIAHRWSATQVWPNDDAKVYCRCGTLLLGTTEVEAHTAWAAHVFEALRAALTAQTEQP